MIDTSLITRRDLIIGAAGAALACTNAAAQDAGKRTVRVVAPYAPGGATDLMARMVAAAITSVLGTPTVVENKTGAGGNIGAGYVAKSAADGTNLLMGAVSVSINQTLYPDLGFDILKDLRPVSILVRIPNVLVVNAESPVHTFPDFLAYLKQNQGSLNFGSSGVGGLPHLATEMMLSMAGAKAQHIAYRGTAPAAAALLAGEVHFILENLPPLMPHIQSGKLRLIAVSTPNRLPDFPQVHCIGEILKGYEAVSWQCLLAPSGVPQAQIDQLYDVVNQSFRTPASQERLAKLGAQPVLLTPAQSALFLKNEVDKWGSIVKKLNLKPV